MDLTDGSSGVFQHTLPDGTRADYVLCDRQGRPMAALEAKRASADPVTVQEHGRHYAVPRHGHRPLPARRPPSADDDRHPVALLFAGDDRYTLGNPIDAVLATLGLTVV